MSVALRARGGIVGSACPPNVSDSLGEARTDGNRLGLQRRETRRERLREHGWKHFRVLRRTHQLQNLRFFGMNRRVRRSGVTDRSARERRRGERRPGTCRTERTSADRDRLFVDPRHAALCIRWMNELRVVGSRSHAAVVVGARRIACERIAVARRIEDHELREARRARALRARHVRQSLLGIQEKLHGQTCRNRTKSDHRSTEERRKEGISTCELHDGLLKSNPRDAR